MTIKTSLVIGGLALLAAPLATACDYPERPAIPDGSTASKDEMMAAKNDVSTFLAGVDEYLTCIESSEKAAVAVMEDPDPAELQRRDDLDCGSRLRRPNLLRLFRFQRHGDRSGQDAGVPIPGEFPSSLTSWPTLVV